MSSQLIENKEWYDKEIKKAKKDLQKLKASTQAKEKELKNLSRIRSLLNKPMKSVVNAGNSK